VLTVWRKGDMRRLWRRLAALLGVLAERVRAWSALARATRHYGRAKRVGLYVVGLVVAAIADAVLDWLLHGQ
jgi:hypothetical protein